MTRKILWQTILLPLAAACGSSSDITCPQGTHQVGDVCVLLQEDLSCGPGTVNASGTCLPAVDGGPGLTCGPGTHAQSGECLPNTDGTICGPGTHLSGDQCVSDGNIVCGPGTHVASGSCVPDASSLTCGPGTFEQSGQCVPVGAPPKGDSYQVFVGANSLPADGFSKIPVLVVGTDMNGNPSNASVILKPSRADAGAISPFNVTLGALGATTFFTPCNAAQDPACVGPFNVTLALANAPATVIAASTPVNLVAPMGIGSAAPCLIGGNVVFFDGDAQDYIHPGTATIQLGQWSAQYSTFHASVHVTPGMQSQGLWWDFDFATDKLNQPITTQVYDNAERWPFQSPGKPGLSVDGDGKGCNTLTGSFQVEALTVAGNTLKSFTATFIQHCEGGSAALRGCVHFEQ